MTQVCNADRRLRPAARHTRGCFLWPSRGKIRGFPVLRTVPGPEVGVLTEVPPESDQITPQWTSARFHSAFASGHSVRGEDNASVRGASLEIGLILLRRHQVIRLAAILKLQLDQPALTMRVGIHEFGGILDLRIHRD